MDAIIDLIMDVPPVTRSYLIGAFVLSLVVQCGVINPLQLYFTYRSAFQQFQIWRIFTCFLYWGDLSIDYVFHMFFFMRYSKMLEESTFHGRRSDYVWLLICSSVVLLVLSPLLPSPFLSNSLSFSLVYLWARHNPTIRLSLFGLLTVPAPYLPFILVIFSWALASPRATSSPNSFARLGLGIVMSDLVGIFAGHWWYFWTEVWKRELGSGGRNWMVTPRSLVWLLDSRDRLTEYDTNQYMQEQRERERLQFMNEVIRDRGNRQRERDFAASFSNSNLAIANGDYHGSTDGTNSPRPRRRRQNVA